MTVDTGVSASAASPRELLAVLHSAGQDLCTCTDPAITSLLDASTELKEAAGVSMVTRGAVRNEGCALVARGSAVGFGVGVRVGETEGGCVGCADGDAVGSQVGEVDGCGDGSMEGAPERDRVGGTLGNFDGSGVVIIVGSEE